MGNWYQRKNDAKAFIYVQFTDVENVAKKDIRT